MTFEMEQNGAGRWSMSDLHTMSTQKTSTLVKQEIYAQWANSYDKEVMSNEYVGPRTAAEKTVEVIVRNFGVDEKISVLDAGCGTGLLGTELKEQAIEAGITVRILGADFSAEMLAAARGKEIYEKLLRTDLNDELPVSLGTVEVIASCGVFLEGHCGPKAFGNLLRFVKKGGFVVVTMRQSTFKEEGPDYVRMIKINECELVANEVGPYLGPVEAHFLIVRKLS
eukprot:GFKZ01016113.1.p1 GENE.GFKZ01016113.1~~GFKZ01016113.1.p1  ORF type:complete len:225 (-),score=34.94 GFKZ01016113.1:351-1025(-)